VERPSTVARGTNGAHESKPNEPLTHELKRDLGEQQKSKYAPKKKVGRGRIAQMNGGDPKPLNHPAATALSGTIDATEMVFVVAPEIASQVNEGN
jgi:hypothetical protein